MTKRRGRGLLAIWSDAEPALQDAFQADLTRHLRALLAVPGVLDAGLYTAVDGGPQFLAVVELEDHFVFTTAAFQLHWYPPHGEPGWRDMGRNQIRNLYRQIVPERLHPDELTRDMPPYLSLGRMGLGALADDEFNAWYNAVHLPRHVAVDGCLGARRFAIVDGHPKYMTIYDVADPAIRSAPAWKAASVDPWSNRMRPLAHDPGSPGVYQRRFPPLSESPPPKGSQAG